ncbi:MAG: alpha amylase, catalytic domain protein [Micavibrio sp.]|nr:alpha amylase, catalytic domain protein [Micavibrio sp.]
MSRNEWWRGGVVYQVYPRSYHSSKAGPVGDLKGITEKIPYIAGLGVDAIWLSPFFKSPQKDYGYDVSDYRDVDAQFGTLDDFRTLLEKAHKLNLKIIVDLVMSHTSEEHAWFKESRQDKTNPKADWYVWADPKPDGSPPNNWLSVFGGSAWQFNMFRGQYYLHNFLPEQPDLNYHNPEVVDAMLGEAKFWLDFGVDGFRLDAVNFCTHDKLLRDNPPRTEEGNATQLSFKDVYSMQWHKYDKSQPENLNFMRRIRKLLDQYPHRMAVAEIGDDYQTQVAAAYTATPDLLSTAYSFALMANKGTMPKASFFRETLEAQGAEPGDSWPAWAFSNHDVIRAPSRWSGTEYGHDARMSKMLIALVGALRGTPFIYQGEELGLPEADIPFDKICDPWGKYLYPKWKGRDGCRTPMPWDEKTPDGWLPVPDEHRRLSVAVQDGQKGSTLEMTREFLHWRRTQPALITGDIKFADSGTEDVLLFTRSLDGVEISCAFNLTASQIKAGTLDLKPFEARFSAKNAILFTSAKA